MRLERLASAARPHPVHHHHELGPATPHGEPAPVGDGAFERIVLRAVQLSHFRAAWHGDEAMMVGAEQAAQPHQLRANVASTRRRALDLVQRNVLLRRVRERDVARPEADRRNPRLVEQRRVGPRRHPLDARRLAVHLQRRQQPAHDRRIHRHVARPLRHHQVARTRRRSAGAPAPRRRRARPPRRSRRRARPESCAARARSTQRSGYVDMPIPPSMSRRMQRPPAEQRMRAPRQHLGVDAIELGEQQPGMPNGVDADVPAAAVRRAPGDLHLDPHEAAMRRHDRERRRLGDDRGVGAHAALDQRARAERLVLLVGDRRDDDLAARCPPARRATPPRTSPRCRPSCPPSRGRTCGRRAPRASNGACIIPSMPTTSRWPLNISERLAPPRRRCARRRSAARAPRRAARCGSPTRRARRAGAWRRRARPAPPATSDGLRESTRTSARVSARASPGCDACRSCRSSLPRSCARRARRRPRIRACPSSRCSSSPSGATARASSSSRPSSAMSEHASAARRAERLAAERAGCAARRRMIASMRGVVIDGCSAR